MRWVKTSLGAATEDVYLRACGKEICVHGWRRGRAADPAGRAWASKRGVSEERTWVGMNDREAE